MKRADFDAIVEATVAKTASLLVQKGAEYAGDADRLINFKRTAARNGVTVLDAWQTYWGKHVDSINTYMARVKDEAVRQAILEIIASVGVAHGGGKITAGEASKEFAALADPERFRKAVNRLIPTAMRTIEEQLSEPIEGRFHDNINYSFLCIALLEELRKETP